MLWSKQHIKKIFNVLAFEKAKQLRGNELLCALSAKQPATV